YHWHNALSLKYQEKYSLHLDHSITGSQYMTDDNALTYKGHQLTNLSASARLGNLNKLHLQISTGVRNLFYTHYASMILINAPSFGGSAPRYYYPGLPRNFYVAVQFNL
ncbi:MAG: TonB-dependent receptor, partial [Salinivirgaceae bacterium]